MKFLIDLETNMYPEIKTATCWIHLQRNTTVFWNGVNAGSGRHLGWFTMEFNQ